MSSQQLNNQVELLSGSFSPSEVGDLILSSIDHQINTYKLKNLSNWIHDNNCDQKSCRTTIQQLENRKQELKGLISEAKTAGCNLKLSEKLEIEMDKQNYNFVLS